MELRFKTQSAGGVWRQKLLTKAKAFPSTSNNEIYITIKLFTTIRIVNHGQLVTRSGNVYIVGNEISDVRRWEIVSTNGGQELTGRTEAMAETVRLAKTCRALGRRRMNSMKPFSYY